MKCAFCQRSGNPCHFCWLCGKEVRLHVLVPPPAVTNTCSPYHALALIPPLQVDGGTFPSHYQWWNLMGCPNSQMEGGTGIAWTTWSKLLAVVLIAVLGLPAVALAVATLLLCLPCFYSRIKQSACAML